MEEEAGGWLGGTRMEEEERESKRHKRRTLPHQDGSHDKAVDTQNTCHDNWHNILHNLWGAEGCGGGRVV